MNAIDLTAEDVHESVRTDAASSWVVNETIRHEPIGVNMTIDYVDLTEPHDDSCGAEADGQNIHMPQHVEANELVSSPQEAQQKDESTTTKRKRRKNNDNHSSRNSLPLATDAGDGEHQGTAATSNSEGLPQRKVGASELPASLQSAEQRTKTTNKKRKRKRKNKKRTHNDCSNTSPLGTDDGKNKQPAKPEKFPGSPPKRTTNTGSQKHKRAKKRRHKDGRDAKIDALQSKVRLLEKELEVLRKDPLTKKTSAKNDEETGKSDEATGPAHRGRSVSHDFGGDAVQPPLCKTDDSHDGSQGDQSSLKRPAASIQSKDREDSRNASTRGKTEKETSQQSCEVARQQVQPETQQNDNVKHRDVDDNNSSDANQQSTSNGQSNINVVDQGKSNAQETSRFAKSNKKRPPTIVIDSSDSDTSADSNEQVLQQPLKSFCSEPGKHSAKPKAPPTNEEQKQNRRDFSQSNFSTKAASGSKKTPQSEMPAFGAQRSNPPPPPSSVPNYVFSKSPFRTDVDYNYSFSQRAAFEEQERLFRESRARVQANRAGDAVGTFPHPPPVFTSPVQDIAKFNSDHYKWPDPYARLGLPPGCPIFLVKKQYRRLALLYHPDKSKLRDAQLRFQSITEAYKKLTRS